MNSEKPILAPDRPHPALVLGVYAEELAHGARAAVFGDATLGVAEELVERGARLVHVYDTDRGRIAEATARGHHRSIFYAPLPDGGDVGVRDGAFDFVLVPDLSFTDDPAALLRLVRRVLSPLGAALIATPNADAKAPLVPQPRSSSGLGYYELYEAVAAHFSSVRMIGQAPFVGYAIAEFAATDPEPTIDTSLAGAEGKEPDWFLALASDRSVRLEPFALIEIPRTLELSRPAPHLHLEDNAGPSAELLAREAAAGPGTVLVNILEAEREAALEGLRQQEHLVREERLRGDHAIRELAACHEELVLLRERRDTLQERLEQEETRRSSLEIELEKMRHNPELGAMRERSRSLEAAVVSLESKARALGDEHTRQIERLEAQLQKSQAPLQDDERAREVDRFETQLRDQGKELSDLRAEITRRERLVRELIAERMASADEAPESQANGHDASIADLHAQLDRLAGDAARREADLTAATWKISQLERELTPQR